MLIVVMPWVARNAVRLDGPALSTNGGVTLLGAYCDDMFRAGPQFGSWSVGCTFREAAEVDRTSGPVPPVAEDRRLVRRALEFAREHSAQLPQLVAAHIGRLWGIFHSGDQVTFEDGTVHSRGWVIAGQYVHWFLLPFALVGLACARRREWLLIAGPLVLVTLNAAVFYGSTRLRAGAEASIALSAAGMMWLVRAMSGGRFAEASHHRTVDA